MPHLHYFFPGHDPDLLHACGIVNRNHHVHKYSYAPCLTYFIGPVRFTQTPFTFSGALISMLLGAACRCAMAFGHPSHSPTIRLSFAAFTVPLVTLLCMRVNQNLGTYPSCFTPVVVWQQMSPLLLSFAVPRPSRIPSSKGGCSTRPRRLTV